VLDAYTGKSVSQLLPSHQTFQDELQLDRFGGWYDLIVKVSGDASFNYQLAGHVQTGKDSITDPALGSLVTLKG
jgi:phospholipase C